MVFSANLLTDTQHSDFSTIHAAGMNITTSLSIIVCVPVDVCDDLSTALHQARQTGLQGNVGANEEINVIDCHCSMYIHILPPPASTKKGCLNIPFTPVLLFPYFIYSI